MKFLMTKLMPCLVKQIGCIDECLKSSPFNGFKQNITY